MMWQIAQTPPPDIAPIAVPPDFPVPVFVLIALAVIGGFVFVFFPLVKALARRIEGKGQLDSALRDELEQLRARGSEVDHLHQRVAELEERLDFAERMLAQRASPERLPEGRS